MEHGSLPAFDKNKIDRGQQPDRQYQWNEFFKTEQQQQWRKEDQQDHDEGRDFFNECFNQY
jgi:hypothetical protein